MANFLPLITIPYLTRMLGLEMFGLYIYILAIVTFIDSIVAYGFRVTGTNQIAQNMENSEYISEVFWSIIYTKTLMLVLIVALFITLCMFIPSFYSNTRYIILGIPLVVGNTIFPIWLFQGMQNMKIIAILHILTKVGFVFAIFVFVVSPDDVGIAILLHSLSFFVAGVVSIYIALSKYRVPIKAPSMVGIKQQLWLGKDIFASQIMTSLYTTVNTIIIGNNQVGANLSAFAIGEKIYRLAGSLSAPYNRTIYPMLSAEYLKSGVLFKRNVGKSFLLVALGFTIVGAFIYGMAPQIIDFLLGSIDSELHALAVDCLKTLSFGIPFFALSALTTYIIVILNTARKMLKVLIAATIANLILIYPLLNSFGVIGVCFLMVGIQVFISSSQSIIVLSSIRLGPRHD